MEGDGLRAVIVDAPIARTWHKKVNREDSLARNVRLLKLMIKEHNFNHPRYSRWVYYLARELGDMGQTDESLKFFRERAQLGGFWEEKAQAALKVVQMLKHKGKYHEAILAGYEALKICDDWRDPYYLIADCYYQLKKYDKAVSWLKHTLEVSTPNTILWKWESVYQYLPQLLLSMCYEEIGDISLAIAFAQQELANAPKEQHARIEKRLKSLELKIK
jgi:tetratricopeptide (TPR) repeat protein